MPTLHSGTVEEPAGENRKQLSHLGPTQNNRDSKAREALETARELIDGFLKRHSPESTRWSFEDGLALGAILSLGKKTGNFVYTNFVKLCIDSLLETDGTIKTYRLEDYNLAQINTGKVLFELFQKSGELKYRKAIETLREQLRRQPRTKSGSFWHKAIYPQQIWLDGAYMFAPFYARYAWTFGEPQSFDDICDQMLFIAGNHRDPVTGLLYHGWDESKVQQWSDPKTGLSSQFWGRSIGWYVMALIDLLDFLPEDHPSHNKLLTLIAELGETLLRFQDPESGLWRQIVNVTADPRNFLETSASCMFTYFLLKSLRKNYLSSHHFAAPSLRGFEAIKSLKLKRDSEGAYHISDICRTAGLGGAPYRDGTYEYYISEKLVDDDFKGIGPFILASIERSELDYSALEASTRK